MQNILGPRDTIWSTLDFNTKEVIMQKILGPWDIIWSTIDIDTTEVTLQKILGQWDIIWSTSDFKNWYFWKTKIKVARITALASDPGQSCLDAFLFAL